MRRDEGGRQCGGQVPGRRADVRDGDDDDRQPGGGEQHMHGASVPGGGAGWGGEQSRGHTVALRSSGASVAGVVVETAGEGLVGSSPA